MRSLFIVLYFARYHDALKNGHKISVCGVIFVPSPQTKKNTSVLLKNTFFKRPFQKVPLMVTTYVKMCRFLYPLIGICEK